MAIGRRNWLFVGSNNGGKTAAVLMSLCTTCKAWNIDPFAYLRDVLDRVSTHPNRRIDELLPDRWKPAELTGLPMRAALYARVSTHDQQTLGLQVEAMRAYIKDRSWDL